MNIVHREWQRIKTSSIARNGGWIMAGQGVSLVLQAIYFVLLARLLGATEYGIFVGAFAFVNLIGKYSTLGTGGVFLRYVSIDKKQFALFFGNMLLVIAIGGVAMTAIMVVAGTHLLNPKSAAVVLLAALSNCFGLQITTCTAQIFQAMEKMRITALLNLSNSFVRTLAAAALFVTIHHATAWQWALTSTIVSLAGAIVALGIVAFSFSGPQFSLSLLRKRFVEGCEFAFASSTTSAYNDLDKSMLSHYGMNAANGIYTLAYRAVDIATLPIVSLRDAAMPHLFRKGAVGLGEAADFAWRLWRRTFLVSLAMSAGMFLFAPLAAQFAGKGFGEVALAMRWLCLIPIFRSVHEISGSALTGSGFQRYRTGTQICAVLLNLVLNLWLIPRYSWHGAAWSSLVTDGALGAMNWGMLTLLVRDSKFKTAEPAAS